MTAILKKLWKNEYFQTAVIIGFIALIVFGFWYGAQIVLNTQYPALAVISGSMCVPQDSQCDGWTHPFSPTLHIGDLIIVQGVDPSDLSADYPNSDIIVFHKPTDPSDLIVHRIVAKEEFNDTIYFKTKGDGNGINKWPSIPVSSDYDHWSVAPGAPSGIPAYMVVGKVVMRIPWLGHIVLFMRDSVGLPVIIALIILLVVVEFVVPLFRRKEKPTAEPEKQEES